MKLTLLSFSDPKKIESLQIEIDSFVSRVTNSPWALSLFLQNKMESTLRVGLIPVTMVLIKEKKIVGIAAIKLRKFGLFRYANSLFDYWFSPDILLDKKYSEVGVQTFLNFIFKKLNCQFAELILPRESNNLRIIQEFSNSGKLALEIESDEYLHHATIPVTGSWEAFEKNQGTDWRHNFKASRRKLDKLGTYHVSLFEENPIKPETVMKITEIEQASWKDNWRREREMSEDHQLFDIIALSNKASELYPDFKSSIRFLELNGRAIAYTFVVKHKGIGFIVKSTFNNFYRKAYPGMFLINESIGDLHKSGDTTLIDFMTNLPATKKWHATPIPRVRLMLWNGFLPKIVRLIIRQPKTKTIKQLIKK
jgi:hypothetical protein